MSVATESDAGETVELWQCHDITWDLSSNDRVIIGFWPGQQYEVPLAPNASARMSGTSIPSCLNLMRFSQTV